MSRKRRHFSRSFKLRLLQEIDNGKSVAEVAHAHRLHPTQVYTWRKEFESLGEDAFPGKGRRDASAPSERPSREGETDVAAH